MDKKPSDLLDEVVIRLRRIAIGDPKILPIAEKIEAIAEKQRAYESERDREGGR